MHVSTHACTCVSKYSYIEEGMTGMCVESPHKEEERVGGRRGGGGRGERGGEDRRERWLLH